MALYEIVRDGAGPASYAQEGIWLACMRDPSASAYHEPLLLRFAIRPDPDRLRQALNAVIARHPALRTVFRAGHDGLTQVVLERVTVAPADLEPRPAPAVGLDGQLAALAAAPFDLERGPLFRARLLELDAGAWLLVLVAHHAVVDGWSLGVFCRDFFACLAAWPRLDPSGLPLLPRTPLEHARTQRGRAAGPEMQAGLDYWRSLLAGAPAQPLFAPVASAEPGAGQVTCMIGAERHAVLQALARRLRTSPFCILLGVFACVLAEVAACRDLKIAIDVADRNSRGDEDLIGMFVNQLPLRLRCEQARSGRDFIETARAACLGALMHKDVPYALIRRHASMAGAGADADFQAKFVLHSAPLHATAWPALGASLVETGPACAKFPLLLEFWQEDGGLRGVLIHDRRFVEAPRAARILARMEERIGQVLADVDAPLAAAAGPAGAGRLPFAPQRRTVPAGGGQVDIAAGGQQPGYPAVFQNSTPGLDLAGWAGRHRDLVEQHLRAAGGVLFRGFYVGAPQRFAQLVEEISGPCLDYVERSTPRTEVAPGIYTSTEYPADQEIFFHNENAYATTFPSRLHFWCQQAPAAGGATPLADCRKIHASLPDDVVDTFRRLGVLYRRSFQPGLGLAWQTVFGVDTAEALSRRYGPAGYRFEWQADRLVASLRLPAVLDYPDSQSPVWFNHAALFHAAALPPDVRRQLQSIGASALQVDTRLGNDEPIPDEWIAVIRAAYRRHASQFDWQADDLLVLDNRLIAHGRTSYTPPRRIIAAMTGPTQHQRRFQ